MTPKEMADEIVGMLGVAMSKDGWSWVKIRHDIAQIIEKHMGEKQTTTPNWCGQFTLELRTYENRGDHHADVQVAYPCVSGETLEAMICRLLNITSHGIEPAYSDTIVIRPIKGTWGKRL